VLEGTTTAPGLSADTQTIGLQGSAPANPLIGQSTEEGLDGQSAEGGLDGHGEGNGLTGFVAEPASELNVPQPPPPEPIRFELRDLHFEYDSAVLAQSEKSVIAELAAIIVRTAPKSITLIGHTDRRGPREYNLDLSKRRAQAVRNALVEWHGLDPALFQVFGRGKEELLSAGLNEADHARDRRVEVILNQRN
jgi:outer membrane protein OmpA-like peptidoglycan-associated protein